MCRILLIITTVSITSNLLAFGATTVDLLLISDGSNVTCIATKPDAALTFIGPYGEDLSQYRDGDASDVGGKIKLNLTASNLVSSQVSTMDYVTDRRWRDLPFWYGSEWKLMKNDDVRSITLSIRANSSLTLNLPKVALFINKLRRDVWYNMQIVWNGKNTTIRWNNEYHELQLQKEKEKKKHLNEHLTSWWIDDDLGFVNLLSPTKRAFYLKTHDYHFLHWSKNFDITPIGAVSKTEDTICVAFYVSACSKCNLRIELRGNSSRSVSHINVDGIPGRKWVEKRIKFTSTINETVHVYAKGSSSSTSKSGDVLFWAIDDDARFCQPRELNMITVSQNCTCKCAIFEENQMVYVESAKKVDKTQCPAFPYVALLEDGYQLENKTICHHVAEASSTQSDCFFLESFNCKNNATVATIACSTILGSVLILVLIGFVVWKKFLQKAKRMSGNDPMEETSLFEAIDQETNSLADCILVEHLGEYLNELTSDTLEASFRSVPKIMNKTRICGELDKNLMKNRFKDIIPYDDSRVILKTTENDDCYGDYINASYVNDFDGKRSYIAAQGPLKETINDFWKMIWQNDVKQIVMLNLLSKDSEEKYWPEKDAGATYGDLHVKCTEQSELTMSIRKRIFRMEQNETHKTVNQLQYLSWPDKAEPATNVLSLFPILDSMVSRNLPTLVHCNAGVGRTGTLILSIYLLSQAKTGSVNFADGLRKIHEFRPYFLTRLAHYKMAHVLVCEYLTAKDTGSYCDANFQKKLDTILYTSSIEDELYHFKKQSERTNKLFMSEHNADLLKPYMSVAYGEYEEKFAVLASDSLDLWSTVKTKHINLMLKLNGSLAPYFTPMVDKQRLKDKSFEVNKLRFLYDRFKDTVKIYDFTNWHELLNYDIHNNEKITEMIDLWRIAASYNEQVPILVCCSDGIVASSIFIAAFMMLEKIQLENVCDVSYAFSLATFYNKRFNVNRTCFEILYKIAEQFLKNRTKVPNGSFAPK